MRQNDSDAEKVFHRIDIHRSAVTFYNLAHRFQTDSQSCRRGMKRKKLAALFFDLSVIRIFDTEKKLAFCLTRRDADPAFGCGVIAAGVERVFQKIAKYGANLYVRKSKRIRQSNLERRTDEVFCGCSIIMIQKRIDRNIFGKRQLTGRRRRKLLAGKFLQIAGQLAPDGFPILGLG